jgi:hypothetical protein
MTKQQMSALIWPACETDNAWGLKKDREWVYEIRLQADGFYVFPTRESDLSDIRSGPYLTWEQAVEALERHLGCVCRLGCTL